MEHNSVYSPYFALWLRGECAAPEQHLLAWAHSQRLLPLLLWRAQQQEWNLPPSFARAARDARYREQAQQMLAESQLRALGTLALSLNIPVVLVKGASVAQAYPEPWMRPFSDIDLLVAETHLPVFLDALIDAGYGWIETMVGQRGWHLPPLAPKGAGLKIEVHTSLAREREQALFTFEQWRDALQPWALVPGLWLPDPVEHALYMVHHAVAHHELTLGLLPFADLKFWTQSWDLYAWQRLAAKSMLVGLHRAVGLALALTAWMWDTAWQAEIQQLFPSPSSEILITARRIVLGEGVQKLPRVWRDLPERNVRGMLRYLNLILLGDPDTRRALPWKERVKFYLHRPFQLVRNHAPTLWRLARGDRRTCQAWQVTRQLQQWMSDSEQDHTLVV